MVRTMDASSDNASLQPCKLCRKQLPADELVRFGEDVVCGDCKPRYVQSLKEGVRLHGAARPGDTCWRMGPLVVLRLGHQLPQRCIHCNERAVAYGRKARRLQLLRFNYVAVPLPLCNRHLWRRRLALAFEILLMVGAVIGLAGVGAMEVAGLAVLAALGLFFMRPLFGKVSIHRADSDFIWLYGVNKQFLESLPEWPD